MSKYKPETEFKVDKTSRGMGGIVYNLRQDGYRNGEPNMVNDVMIQITGHNLDPLQIKELEDIIVDALNEKYTEPSVNSIEEFYEIYFEHRHGYPQQRDGQFTFNLMYELRPDLANKYRGSDVDPFYDNSRIDAFLKACFSE